MIKDMNYNLIEIYEDRIEVNNLLKIIDTTFVIEDIVDYYNSFVNLDAKFCIMVMREFSRNYVLEKLEDDPRNILKILDTPELLMIYSYDLVNFFVEEKIYGNIRSDKLNKNDLEEYFNIYIDIK